MTTTTAPTFLKRLFGPARATPAGAPSLTLRFAHGGDGEAIERLAQLDSRRAPRGPVLVAEVGGALWAALSLDDDHAVADPFRPTAELVALLSERARQIHRAARGAADPIAPVWPRAGYDHAAWN